MASGVRFNFVCLLAFLRPHFFLVAAIVFTSDFPHCGQTLVQFNKSTQKFTTIHPCGIHERQTD